MRPSRSTFVVVVFLLSVACGLLATTVPAAELPKGFRLEPVLSGLTNPSALAITSGGRILITERTTGAVRVVRLGELQVAPACTLPVHTAGEAGLLGIALHPSHSSNGWFYVYYTHSGTLKNRVSRLTLQNGTCGDELVILPDVGAGSTFTRNGGGMGFGPDGKLYVATGDMESPANSQTDGTFPGKILRVNDDGTNPPDNPPGWGPVYAEGIRDGRAVSINPAGNVYTADHGLDPIDADEANQVPAGANMGWGGGPAPVPPLVSWLPTLGLQGLAVYGATAFPDLAANGLDDDHDRFGPNRFPGRNRMDDNGQGTCVSTINNGAPCTTDAQCPAQPGGFETAYCEKKDDLGEWCPSGTPINDDDCDALGPAGLDEPDESYALNVFAATNQKIQRVVLTPSLTALSTWKTFMDSTALSGCPTGWSGVAVGGDGFLYAVATNGGGSAGALYRVIHDETPGPREVSQKGSPFPVRVERGTNANEVTLYWEDLRDDSKQPRDNGTSPLAPVREYTVWHGPIGSFSPYTHSPVSGLGATTGVLVNDAVRSVLVPSNAPDNEYFLVSGRSANLEGALGKGRGAAAPPSRPGYAVTDLCTTIGYHDGPSFPLFTCGRDFDLFGEYGTANDFHDLYAEHRGKVVLLDFSAIWCGPCQSQANVLESLYQAYKDRDVEILTILMDDEVNGLFWQGRPNPAECRNWGDRTQDHTFECWTDPAICPMDPCDFSGGTSNPPPTLEAWDKYDKHNALPTNVILDTGMRVAYTEAGYSATNIQAAFNALVGTADSCLH